MSIWRNVLVYADGRPESEVALSEGIRLAAHADGRVMAFDVLHHLPTRLPAGLLALAQKELLELMIEQRDAQLHEDVERLRVSDSAKVKVTYGSPAFELIRQAVRGQHDLIVKAARGRDVRRMTSFGTTALHLIRKSPVPVLVMSPDKRLLDRPKLLCALDLDDYESKLELNRSLLAAARSLAEVFDAPLHIVHVLDNECVNVYRAFLAADTFEQFVKGWRQALEKALEQLVARELQGLSEVHAHLVHGDTADVIVKLAEEQKMSHLVLGSVARREPGLLIGSLAEDVLARVDCSVLTIKPAGFETPVDVTGEAREGCPSNSLAGTDAREP